MAEMGSINIPLELDTTAFRRTMAHAEEVVARFRANAEAAGLSLPKQPDAEKLADAVNAVAEQIIRASAGSNVLDTSSALRNVAEAVMLLRGGVCGSAEETPE